MGRTMSVVAICMMFLVVPLLGQTDPVQPPVVPSPIVAPIASPVAKIVGPKEAPAGELVVLSF